MFYKIKGEAVEQIEDLFEKQNKMVRAYKKALFVPESQVTRKKQNASRHGNQKAGQVQSPDAHVQPSHETSTSTARGGCTSQQARRQLSPLRRQAKSRSAKI